MTGGSSSEGLAGELVALDLLCAPRTRPLHHIQALIMAGRLPRPARVLDATTELVPADYLERLDPAVGPAPDAAELPDEWRDHVERGIERFSEGVQRLPRRPPERRGPQLLRMGGGAWIAGLALLMSGQPEHAEEWLDRAACCYRRSLADAEPGNWGRCIAAMKARLIAHDWRGARHEARWNLELGAAEAASPIARYAAAIALLVLGQDQRADELAASLDGEDAFPEGIATTAAALRAIAMRDRAAYGVAVREMLRSFEDRPRFLEKVPVADTVIVVQRLANVRGIGEVLSSARLPATER